MSTDSASFEEAGNIISTLLQAGHQAYLVGGFVRDYLLGRTVHDIDIATSALPADVMRLFARAVPTGIEHGTVTVLSGTHSFEVTTFRREGEYEDHRRPDEVEFVDSLEEDLSRRDFTINAMAMDVDGNVIDPFGGQADLEARVLRCVGDAADRFQEDALRMLRCIRFAANYALTIDDSAWSAILDHRGLLKHIAMERVRIELVKTIEGTSPERGVELLVRSGLLRFTKAGLNWRPFTENIDEEANRRWDCLVREEALGDLSPTARWAYLLLAGAHTADEIDLLLRQLTFSNEARSGVMKIISLHDYVLSNMPVHLEEDQLIEALRTVWTDGAITFGKHAADGLLELPHAFEGEPWHSHYRTNAGDWLARITVWSPGDLEVDGHDLMRLGKRKGPWLGKLLHALVVDTALGTVANRKADLLARAEQYAEKWELQ